MWPSCCGSLPFESEKGGHVKRLGLMAFTLALGLVASQAVDTEPAYEVDIGLATVVEPRTEPAQPAVQVDDRLLVTEIAALMEASDHVDEAPKVPAPPLLGAIQDEFALRRDPAGHTDAVWRFGDTDRIPSPVLASCALTSACHGVQSLVPLG